MYLLIVGMMWPLWSTITCLYQYLNILIMQIQNSSMSPFNWATFQHTCMSEMNLLSIFNTVPTSVVSFAWHSLTSPFTHQTNKLRTDWWPVQVAVETASSTKKNVWNKKETLKTNSCIKGSTSRDVSLVFIVFFFCLAGEVWTCVINVTDLQFNSCTVKPHLNITIHNWSRSNYPPLSGDC